MGSPAFWGMLVNFEAGLRKPALIPFGLFSPGDNLGFIAGIDANGMLGYAVEAPNGVVSTPGTTFTFTFAPTIVVFNGLSLFPPTDYTVVGVTVTLPFPAYAGDKIYGIS